MRRFSYILALLLCTVSVTAQLVPGLPPFGSLFILFANPIPAPLIGLVPVVLRLLLTAVFAGLLYRRLLLSYKAKVLQPPESLTLWPGRLLSISVVFLVTALVALGLSIALRAGSGVPAGMVGLPAVLLLSPVLFYVELRSLPWLAQAE